MLRKSLLSMLAAVLVPAFAGAVDLSQIPNGFANSKVGDWLKYKTIMGEQVMTLTSIEGEGENTVVKIRTDLYLDGEVISSMEDRMPLRNFFDASDAPWAGEEVEIAEEAVEFKDGKLNVVTIKNADQGIVLQMSAEIPLVGIYKLGAMNESMPVMELVDFGRP